VIILAIFGATRPARVWIGYTFLFQLIAVRGIGVIAVRLTVAEYYVGRRRAGAVQRHELRGADMDVAGRSFGMAVRCTRGASTDSVSYRLDRRYVLCAFLRRTCAVGQFTIRTSWVSHGGTSRGQSVCLPRSCSLLT